MLKTNYCGKDIKITEGLNLSVVLPEPRKPVMIVTGIFLVMMIYFIWLLIKDFYRIVYQVSVENKLKENERSIILLFHFSLSPESFK